MPSQEFRAVIAVESFDRERQGFLNGLDARHYTTRPFVPGRPTFRPTGTDVGHGQTPNEVACQAITAMRHRIGLDEAGLGDIPCACLNRDMLLE